MLNRGRAWLETHQVENNGLLKNIRDSLSDYEAKLQQLRAVLQGAAAQTKQATGLNRENEGALGAIQVSHREAGVGTGPGYPPQTLIKQERGRVVILLPGYQRILSPLTEMEGIRGMTLLIG